MAELISYASFFDSEVSSVGAASNGGRSSNRIIPDDKLDSIFPGVFVSSLSSDLIQYKKIFLRAQNLDDLAILSTFVGLYSYSNFGGSIYLLAGTFDDTQVQAEQYTRLYGYGSFSSAASAGDSSVTISVRNLDDNLFQVGDSIVLVKADGNYERNLVTDVTTLTDTSEYILTLDSQLQADYSENEVVMSVPAFRDIQGKITNVSITSDAGTFDSSVLSTTNAGAEYETITLTFVSSSTFTVSSERDGDLGSGDISTDLTLLNERRGNATRLIIPSTAFGGTFAAGDTIEIETEPAEYPIWLKRIVTAGTVAFSTARLDILAGGAGSE